MTGLQMFAQGPRRRLDVVDDRFVVRTKRRTDVDDDEVVVRDGAEIRGGAEPAHPHVVGHELTEAGLSHGGLAQVDLVDDALSHIDPCYRPATVCQHRTDHRADVAEADHRDPRSHAADEEVDLGITTSERTFEHRGASPFSPPSVFLHIKAWPTTPASLRAV